MAKLVVVVLALGVVAALLGGARLAPYVAVGVAGALAVLVCANLARRATARRRRRRRRREVMGEDRVRPARLARS